MQVSQLSIHYTADNCIVKLYCIVFYRNDVIYFLRRLRPIKGSRANTASVPGAGTITSDWLSDELNDLIDPIHSVIASNASFPKMAAMPIAMHVNTKTLLLRTLINLSFVWLSFLHVLKSSRSFSTSRDWHAWQMSASCVTASLRTSSCVHAS